MPGSVEILQDFSKENFLFSGMSLECWELCRLPYAWSRPAGRYITHGIILALTIDNTVLTAGEGLKHEETEKPSLQLFCSGRMFSGDVLWNGYDL